MRHKAKSGNGKGKPGSAGTISDWRPNPPQPKPIYDKDGQQIGELYPPPHIPGPSGLA